MRALSLSVFLVHRANDFEPGLPPFLGDLGRIVTMDVEHARPGYFVVFGKRQVNGQVTTDQWGF
jgi:hypothetical protein